MAKKVKTHEEELKEAQKIIKEYGKLINEMNKKLKMFQRGEISIEEIKPFFEDKLDKWFRDIFALYLVFFSHLPLRIVQIKILFFFSAFATLATFM